MQTRAHLSCRTLMCTRELRCLETVVGTMYFWTTVFTWKCPGRGLTGHELRLLPKNYRKIYFRSNRRATGCNGGDGDTKVLWDNSQQTTWASGLTKKMQTSLQATFLLHKHQLYEVLASCWKGFRLPDYTDAGNNCDTGASTNGCDKPLYVSFASVASCEATQVEASFFLASVNYPPSHK